MLQNHAECRVNKTAIRRTPISRSQNDISPDISPNTHQSSSWRRPMTRFSWPSNLRGSFTTCALLAGSVLQPTMAQRCIPLAGSVTCPAFNESSISTDSYLVGLFPFLSNVTNVSSFDAGLLSYIAGGYTQEHYQQLLGCSNYTADNTTAYYARYTASVICNSIVQNSISGCSLTGNATRPLCADSCANYAQSEQDIVASNVCGTSSSGALTQIRADFTDCALPADSLTISCVEASLNEADNCGFGPNKGSLCEYCAASSPNATDSCCVFSNTENICEGVTLPVVAASSLTSLSLMVTSSSTSTSSVAASSSSLVTSGASSSNSGLSKGDIAGIVVGSVLGALLLLALIIGGCILLRKRKDHSPATSIFNQPATTRSPQMGYNEMSHDQGGAGLAVLPGGRVARMSALEGADSFENQRTPYASGDYHKSFTDSDNTPQSRNNALVVPPGERSASLSSGSQLAVIGGPGTASDSKTTSPSSNTDNYTSPESHSQSEQLSFFKDYYSQDEIHPGDLVSTLWAYEPRAADEFQLERGDMIRVLGIWDDGWATGVRVRGRAEDWRSEGRILRDSGLSAGSSPNDKPDPTDGDGEVKAFPLVCVCLPQHWRKTIEGDSTEGTAPGP